MLYDSSGLTRRYSPSPAASMACNSTCFASVVLPCAVYRREAYLDPLQRKFRPILQLRAMGVLTVGTPLQTVVWVCNVPALAFTNLQNARTEPEHFISADFVRHGHQFPIHRA